LVEAMAAGVPPVVNAVDGCADLVRDGENGYLVAPGRPDLTADRIVALLENRSLAEVLGGHARSSVGPEFDIDGMVRRQEALYETLVAARRK
jgi:glycosyltransferase involved in cell wall biosynthesis